jgi:hypothetical protein
MSSWAEIKNGYGIEAVPATLVESLACEHCPPGRKNSKLFTTAPVVCDGTVSGHQHMVDRIRTNCFCKYHGIWLFE